MAKVTIYTTTLCGFCHRAKELLRNKGVFFDEIDVTRRPDLRTEMRKRAEGRNSVPQIFIGEIGIGGCDDLFALDRKGVLDGLLAA